MGPGSVAPASTTSGPPNQTANRMRESTVTVICMTVLGVALVIAAVVLLLNGVNGAARAILYGAAATAFGSAAAPSIRSTIRRRNHRHG